MKKHTGKVTCLMAFALTMAAWAQPSLERMLKWAERGDSGEMIRLARAYETGDGVDRSEKEAVKWYRKAAELGNTRAQNELGKRYFEGRGVTKDAAEAVTWFRKAAERMIESKEFDCWPKLNLGWCYEKGEGVPKDEVEAAKWYDRCPFFTGLRMKYPRLLLPVLLLLLWVLLPHVLCAAYAPFTTVRTLEKNLLKKNLLKRKKPNWDIKIPGAILWPVCISIACPILYGSLKLFSQFQDVAHSNLVAGLADEVVGRAATVLVLLLLFVVMTMVWGILQNWWANRGASREVVPISYGQYRVVRVMDSVSVGGGGILVIYFYIQMSVLMFGPRGYVEVMKPAPVPLLGIFGLIICLAMCFLFFLLPTRKRFEALTRPPQG